MSELYWAILNAVFLLLEVCTCLDSSRIQFEFYFIKHLVPYLAMLFVKYKH
jgi:hypothetical protein